MLSDPGLKVFRVYGFMLGVYIIDGIDIRWTTGLRKLGPEVASSIGNERALPAALYIDHAGPPQNRHK